MHVLCASILAIGIYRTEKKQPRHGWFWIFVSLVINLGCAMLNLTIINQSIKLHLPNCRTQTGDLSKIKKHFRNSYLAGWEWDRGRETQRQIHKRQRAGRVLTTIIQMIQFQAHSKQPFPVNTGLEFCHVSHMCSFGNSGL